MNKSVNKRLYKNQPTELNSTANTLDLITPSQTDTSVIPQISPVSTSQVVKRNPEVNMEIAKTTLQQINQVSNLNNNSNISNNSQNNLENTNQITNNNSAANAFSNNNSLTNMYNGYGSMYGGLGGYGAGYGGYGTGLGGYGSMYGGYGGMYGGYGMRGMYGRNQNEAPDFFEKSFMVLEKINFHIFNFCEMIRIMQNQTPAMQFLYDMMKTGINGTKKFFTESAVQFISDSKMKMLNTLIWMRKFIQEFFVEKDLSNEKLKKHIRILDMMIIILLISAVGGIFLKIY